MMVPCFHRQGIYCDSRRGSGQGFLASWDVRPGNCDRHTMDKFLHKVGDKINMGEEKHTHQDKQQREQGMEGSAYGKTHSATEDVMKDDSTYAKPGQAARRGGVDRM